MADFTWVADYAANESSVPRVLEAPFGDGYVQRGVDGLNALLRVWSWSFNTVPTSEANAIIDFLKLKAGVLPFSHDIPGSGETVNVICKSWTKQWAGFEVYNITAKFEEQVTT